MKTLVVGAGVIGTTWGWALSEAGVEVTHLVRAGHTRRFEDGVTLDLRDGRKGHKKDNVAKYSLKCVETVAPSDNYQLMVVPVYFTQVEGVLETLLHRSGDAIFLIFGTNWPGVQTIEKYLPRGRYLMGFPLGGGTKRNGAYSVYLGAKVYLGEVDGRRTDMLQRLKSLFAKADMQSDIPDNILHMLWTSHAVAVGLAAGVAQSRDVASFLRDRALKTQAYYITKEIFELVRLRGADPYKYVEQSGLFRLPPWLCAVGLQLYCVYDPGLIRILAHLAETGDAKEICAAMLQTADELKFDVPRLTAAATHLRHA